LPHAEYELAVWNKLRGVVTPSFIQKPAALVHGNELLLALDPKYPQSSSGTRNYYRVSQHRLELVLDILGNSRLNVGLPADWQPPAGVSDGTQVFVGYLMLDAWIGNQDRHHENWGIVAAPAPENHRWLDLRLAPTFDHASSLGRNESEETMRQRLSTKDAGYTVEAYARRARSAFYAKEGDAVPLGTFDAFQQAAAGRRDAASAWLDRLSNIGENEVGRLIDRVPDQLMSAVAKEFVHKYLTLNRRRLLDFKEQLK
jgi:hypothetical protein